MSNDGERIPRDEDGYEEKMIRIMEGASLAILMLFSWLDPGLDAGRENHLNGDLICRSFAI